MVVRGLKLPTSCLLLNKHSRGGSGCVSSVNYLTYSLTANAVRSLREGLAPICSGGVDWKYRSSGDDGWRVKGRKTASSDDDEGIATRGGLRGRRREQSGARFRAVDPGLVLRCRARSNRVEEPTLARSRGRCMWRWSDLTREAAVIIYNFWTSLRWESSRGRLSRQSAR
jgi:hypothetical protein